MPPKRTRPAHDPHSTATPGDRKKSAGKNLDSGKIQCRWLPDDAACPQEETIDMTQELQHTLEELHVAEEELRMQNDELAQAHDNLESEHARYLDMFQHAPDGYLVTDRAGIIQEANIAAAALLHHRHEHLMGKPVVVFIPETDRSGFHSRLNHLLREVTTQEWETLVQPHTGPAVPVVIRVSPALDHHGQVVGLRWLLRDDTARREADIALWKERNFISAILDTTAALMVVLDTGGCIVHFNRACELVTGYTQTEIMGVPFWDRLLLPEEIADVKRVFAALVAGDFPNEYENYWISKSGERRLVRWSNTVLKDHLGELEYIIATGVDITAQRTAEEQARQHQQALAHSMRVSTIGEMASGLAHEINQPLAAIVNYAQGCVRRLDSGNSDPPGLREAVEQIAVQARRAATIIQHLRHFVTKSTPQRVVADINSLIAQTVKFAGAENVQARGVIQLNLGDIPPVAVDDIQIQQVVLNLVRNALEATSHSANGAVLEIKTCVNSGHEIEVYVRDNGPGLSAEMLDEVFKPFLTTKGNGMGLGLAISRTIIEDHGGHLWAKSNDGPGATFHFTLPLKQQGHGT